MLVALAIPAGCISIVDFVADGYPSRFPYSLLFWLISAPFFVLFAVVCHRSIILGGASLPNRLGLFWSPRETGFLGWTIVIIILIWLLKLGTGLTVVLISPFGFTITVLAMAVFLIYMYVRIAMVLPATAVGDRASFDRAWFLTSGNGFRVMFVIAIATAPVLFATIVLLYLFGASFVGVIVAVLARHAIPMVAICALSVSYRELIEFESSALPE